MRAQYPFDRVPGRRQRLLIERSFGIAGREAGSQQQPVTLSQRHVELLG